MFDLRNKNILITGGTGSFGKACAQFLLRSYSPQRLIIFSRDELKQHEMRVDGLNDPCLRYFIGDVRDLERLKRAMAAWTCDPHRRAQAGPGLRVQPN
jgi:Predicted nucleoside-diphosphate sugar epimerases